jgi:hypothetical protein
MEAWEVSGERVAPRWPVVVGALEKEPGKLVSLAVVP